MSAGAGGFAVCAIILIWFMYYANRANPPHLRSQFILYAFLVPQLASGLRMAFTNRAALASFVLRVGLLIGIVLPPMFQAVAGNRADFQQTSAWFEQYRKEAYAASDIMVPPHVGSAIAARARFLRSVDVPNLSYFSAYSWLMTLMSGRDTGLPTPITFALDIEHYKRELALRKPAVVLIEIPNAAELSYVPSQFLRFCDVLRATLVESGFKKVTEIEGWDIYQLN